MLGQTRHPRLGMTKLSARREPPVPSAQCVFRQIRWLPTGRGVLGPCRADRAHAQSATGLSIRPDSRAPRFDDARCSFPCAGDEPLAVAFTPDGRLLATANFSDGTVSVYEPTQQTQTSVTSAPDPALATQQVTLTATVTPTTDGGTVAFDDGAATIAGCGSQPVNATGTAICSDQRTAEPWQLARVRFRNPPTARVLPGDG
jgi:hypothetical protein